jgi:hypothetical protein
MDGCIRVVYFLISSVIHHDIFLQSLMNSVVEHGQSSHEGRVSIMMYN